MIKIHLFSWQKAEKKYGKPNEKSQTDFEKIALGHQSDGGSDKESGDKKSEDEKDLGPASEEEEHTIEQDDLLVLKKRHVDFDPNPLPDEVDWKLSKRFSVILIMFVSVSRCIGLVYDNEMMDWTVKVSC